MGVMTNFQAFCSGFWSAWDFSRPFSEKAVFHPNGKPFDRKQLREKLGFNENVWDRVGKNIRKAMSQYESEVGIDKIESTK
jgi:hypothetical protein